MGSFTYSPTNRPSGSILIGRRRDKGEEEQNRGEADMPEEAAYVLGHSEEELQRLQLQARCLEGPTRRLITECGIKTGMRVLDFGTGAGDVALLVAQAVGSSGAVVGVDQEERSVRLSQQRAAAAGLRNATFAIGGDESLAQHGPFDAAIGRLVLVHQPDAGATIRRIAEVVKPGGVVAFLEPSGFDESQTPPERKLIIALCRSVGRLMAALPGSGIADRFVPCFLDAGLGEPRVFREAPVVGSPELFLQWGVGTYKAFLPTMERLGIIDPAVGDPETLIERLAAEARNHSGQFVTPIYAGAWAAKQP
jgi:2-polyprenyl-3-methyl-5-hydroxy-6-metoxy-1,4-benzoquinol methylase